MASPGDAAASGGAAEAPVKAVDPAHVDVEMSGGDGKGVTVVAASTAAADGAAAAAAAGDSGKGWRGKLASIAGGKGRRRLFAAAAMILFGIAVGVGVGVGVGIGEGPKKTSAASAPTYTTVTLGAGVSGRTYFIAADPIMWDYAPAGANLCYRPDIAAKYLQPDQGITRVGGTFPKAQYREYTDSSFTTLKGVPSEWAHLGNLGPLIRGSVGDVIRVVFKNNLHFAVNMAPSGGLTAWDGAGILSARPSGAVAAGGTATYLWQVPAAAGPEAGANVTSRLWLYRSSVDPYGHDNAGLVGPVIVTAAEAADAEGKPKDVDREVVALFQSTSEAGSSMFDRATDPSLTAGVSFTKMAINGYTWCNMPTDLISLQVGQRVRWHVASVGSSDGLHNYHWHGHSVELNGRHLDQFTAIPGATYSVNMELDEPGVWMFHCHVNYHMDGGMVNFYKVTGTPAPKPTGGVDRVYYVAAEQVEWSYTGENNTQACMDPEVPFDESVDGFQFVNGPSTDPVRLGHVYTKTMYVEYADANFTTRKNRTQADSYLGIVGPIFRATVGDRILVTLLNRSPLNVSMHPHGVRYSKANEGTLYQDGTDAATKLDDVVQPGQQYTYEWLVPSRAAPGPADPSSLLWMYHSHLDETAESYAGLAGGIIVTDKNKLAANSSVPAPSDVDRELVVFFEVVDEIKSSNFMYNLATKLGDNGALAAAYAANSTLLTELKEDAGFAEHMLKHAINGYMYCHMPRLTFKQGDKVRLHLMVLGTLEDMHTPNLGGPRFAYVGQHTDSLAMSPGSMASTDVVMTQPGEHEFHCRVADHVLSGMRAKYNVTADPAALTTAPSNVTRTYYIQAEPVDWDYAPGGYTRCTNQDLSFEAMTYVTRTSYTIGSKYRKAVYREYTDATFTTRKAAPSYYGTMGPTIAVEVGDTLVVHLRNNLTDLPDWPVNIALGGGLVAEGGEGENCGEVAAGEACVYRWSVPDSAGPAEDDFNTAVYGYTSDVDAAISPYAGLAGALMVGRRGSLKAQAGGGVLPEGVSMVVPLFWQVVNEALSPYFDASLAASKVNYSRVEADDVLLGKFDEGNLMHSINGFVYCNLPRPVAHAGSTVRWLLLAYGTEGDFHSPLFTGQAVTVDHTGFGTQASLMPSIARVADMAATDPGTWLVYCDVHDHYLAGMMGQFTVTP